MRLLTDDRYLLTIFVLFLVGLFLVFCPGARNVIGWISISHVVVLSDGKNSIEHENSFKYWISQYTFFANQVGFLLHSFSYLSGVERYFVGRFSYAHLSYHFHYKWQRAIEVAWVTSAWSQWQILKCHANIQ